MSSKLLLNNCSSLISGQLSINLAFFYKLNIVVSLCNRRATNRLAKISNLKKILLDHVNNFSLFHNNSSILELKKIHHFLAHLLTQSMISLHDLFQTTAISYNILFVRSAIQNFPTMYAIVQPKHTHTFQRLFNFFAVIFHQR